MKKLLLLVLMAGLAFGECRKLEEIDKMTDETIVSFVCSNTSETGGIAFMSDESGRPDFSPQKNISKTAGDGYKIMVIAPSPIHIDKKVGNANASKIKIRIDKNKAYETQIALAQPRSGFLFWLTKEQVDELKTAKTVLVQYRDYLQQNVIIEIDMAGFDNFYRE
nr:invasion associated locus B family protein [uncultured Campylobacter sp.]